MKKLTLKELRTAIEQLKGPTIKPKKGQTIRWYDAEGWHEHKVE